MYQSGALWRSMTLAEVVALAEARRIAPNIEKFNLAQVGKVYGKLEKGQIVGREVVNPLIDFL